jgi:hypothetical protein
MSSSYGNSSIGFVRTQQFLFGIGRKETAKGNSPTR